MGSGILSWGSNDSGQLGVGGSGDRWTPVEIAAPGIGLDVGTISAVSAGLRHSLALIIPKGKSGGEVWAWGDNRFGQLGDNLASIGGQSGIQWNGPFGPDLAPVNNPVRVAGENGVGFLTDVVRIAAGGNHSLAVRADNTVWAWGRNQVGQLGDNTTEDRWVPVQVHGLPEGIPQAIAAGHHHSLAVLLVNRPAQDDQGSQIWAWGDNSFGQLGDGSRQDRQVPVRVKTERRAKSVTEVWHGVAAGSYHSLAIREDTSTKYTLWAWGANDRGQLGIHGLIMQILNLITNSKFRSQLPLPVRLPAGVGDIRQIAAGHEHSLAIVGGTTDSPDSILAWGANYSGQLGNGNKNDQFLPVPVVGMKGIVSVRGGWMHSLASRGDATVWAWGNNGAGQLGNGTGNDSSTPVQVQGALAEVYGSALAAGLHHSLAIGFKSP